MKVYIFADELTRRLDEPSAGKAEIARVATVQTTELRSSSLFDVKTLTPSVTAPDDTDLSDSTGKNGKWDYPFPTHASAFNSNYSRKQSGTFLRLTVYITVPLVIIYDVLFQ